MRRSLILVVSAAVVVSMAASSTALAQQDAPAPGVYAGALSGAVRTEEDRARDATRQTAGTLAFAEVAPGQKIADMIIGGGFFTRVFSSAVGPTGHVTAWQPAEFIGFSADYATSIAAADALDNVDSIRSPISAPEFPAGLDLIFTAQNYHDLHLKDFPADTAAKVNAAAFSALKPGGLYVIADHYAAAGTGITVANSLHRIDLQAVKSEVEAAGFVFEAQSDILASATDPLTANVFDPAIRGRTSQFMLRFRKPA